MFDVFGNGSGGNGRMSGMFGKSGRIDDGPAGFNPAARWPGSLPHRVAVTGVATDGVQVFYRIPQAEYDRLMPLTVTPKPESTVRVGLVLHPHCEPDMAERVLAVLKDLDAEAFAMREAATAKLAAMGPAVFVHLVRLRKAAVSAEVRSRIEQVLEKYESRNAFPRE